MPTHNIAHDKTRINFQITKSQKARLDQIAAERKMSLSDMLREAVLERYIEPPRLDKKTALLVEQAIAAGANAAQDYLKDQLAAPNLKAAEAPSRYGTTSKSRKKKPKDINR